MKSSTLNSTTVKSAMNWQSSQTLNTSTQKNQRQRHLKLGTQLNNLWQSIVAYLASSSEPHVWQTEDAIGKTLWKAYDPLSGKTVQFYTEEQMRIWLEERHYSYSAYGQ